MPGIGKDHRKTAGLRSALLPDHASAAAGRPGSVMHQRHGMTRVMTRSSPSAGRRTQICVTKPVTPGSKKQRHIGGNVRTCYYVVCLLGAECRGVIATGRSDLTPNSERRPYGEDYAGVA